MDTKLFDKQIGCFMGLAIGDALGGPYEFLTKGGYSVSNEYKRGGVFNLKKGEWTDDTSMALCLAKSLIETKKFDPHNQMEKYCDWFNEGYMSSRGVCFDIGTTTRNSILRYQVSKSPYSKYKRGSQSAGNAPIMRLAPIPIFFSDKKELKEYSRLSSKTTHSESICADSTEYFALLISNAIYTNKDKYDLDNDIDISNMDDELQLRIKRAKEHSQTIQPDNYQILPTGYIINTLEVALYAFHKFDNYIDGLLFVISLGEDADTVGAIYGQIAGAYYGYESIPSYYKEKLMLSKFIFSIGEDLIQTSKNK